MLVLEGQQLVLERVVLGVGDVGRVLEVVLGVVALDEGPQLGGAGCRRRTDRRVGRRSPDAMVGGRPAPAGGPNCQSRDELAYAAMPEPRTSSPE